MDAIEPAQLRRIVRECMERYVNKQTLAFFRVAERSERELFTRMIEELGDGDAMTR